MDNPAWCALMPRQESGLQWSLTLLRSMVLLALTAIGGCAQIEIYRLQGEVDELQAQLAYEKQRLKQVTKQPDSSGNQPVKQQKSAKACKPHAKKGVDTRSSTCVSARKVVE